MSIESLKSERAKLIADARAMLDAADAAKRGLTADEQKTYDELTAKADGVKSDIARREALAAAEREIGTPEPRATPAAKPGAEPAPAITSPPSRLRHFKVERDAHVAGMFIKALRGHRMAQQWCRDNGVHYDAQEDRSMVVSNNALGGAFVPDPFRNVIIDIRDQYGVGRQAFENVPMTADTLAIPKSTQGGVTHYWVAEGASKTAADPATAVVTLTAKKLVCRTQISDELLADSAINVGDFIASRFAWQLAYAEDLAFFKGDGTSTYGGLTGLNNAIEAQTTYQSYYNATSGDNTIEEMIASDVIAMVGRLLPQALARARWYGSSQVWAALKALGLGLSGNSADNFAGPLTNSVLGIPFVFTQVMPSAVGTSYDNLSMLLLGDLAMAGSVGNRADMTMAIDPYTNMSTGLVNFYTQERVAFAAHSIGSATELSPVVAYIGNA